jgi:hypothetical protein
MVAAQRIGEEIDRRFLTGSGVSGEMVGTIVFLAASRVRWWW